MTKMQSLRYHRVRLVLRVWRKGKECSLQRESNVRGGGGGGGEVCGFVA